jgi:histidinol dehydrogenase
MNADLPNVEAILEAVRLRGDVALVEFAREFGDPPPRRVPAREIRAAFERIAPEVREALHAAAERIERFAVAQRRALSDVSIQVCGSEVGHRAIPIARVGLYVPAGRHPLPSSLLMGAVPARVARVGSIAVCTPRAADETLAAAAIAGVEEFYELGGAQAIAALAYGTPLIPRVDLIAGPGNAYVAAAKRAVFGVCGIDAIAGPSEVMIVASGDADPQIVAADLLAQLEHGSGARATLLTFDDALAAKIRASVPPADVRVVTPEEAVHVANARAPEHLMLQGCDAQALAASMQAYGALFVGTPAAEVFGDYGIGPNHTLPTHGSARWSSGLSVLTFLTIRTYQRAIGPADPQLVAQTQTLARAEGLEAHGRAAALRGSGP